jgi:hypothetical protein
MPPKQANAGQPPAVPPQAWAKIVLVSWLVPGGGHFMLKRSGRGGLLMGSVILMFLFGLLMRGTMFHWQWGDLLTIVIYCGGFLCDLANGLLYLLATWFGYNQPDIAGHVHDYGTKFLVGAGLLNILAMIDAYEIATRKKE